MRIAISGPLCSGKTTIAEYLRSNHGYTKIGLDSKLNELCSQHSKKVWAFGPIIKDLFPNLPNKDIIYIQCEISDTIFKRIPQSKKSRNLQLMKAINDYLREIDPAVFANWALREIDKLQVDNVVIDDLRYFPDYETLRNAGFTMVRTLVSPSIQAKRAIHTTGVEDRLLIDSSWDQMLDDVPFDIYINSDLPIQQMYAEIDDLILGSVTE